VTHSDQQDGSFAPRPNEETKTLVQQKPLHDQKQSFSKRKSRGLLSRLLIATSSLCIFIAILLGALFAALSRSPLELPFMSERVAIALEQQIGQGVDVDVGRTVLERTGRGLELHVQDIAIRDLDRQVILRAPDALLSFDPLRIFKFPLQPKSLELKGVVVKVSIARDGTMAFSATGESGTGVQPNASTATRQATSTASQVNQERLNQGLAALALIAKNGTSGNLSTIKIEEAVLLVDDQRIGQQLRFHNLSLSFESFEKGTAVASGSLAKDKLVTPFSLDIKTIAENYSFTLKTSNVNEKLIASALGMTELPFEQTGKFNGKAELLSNPKGQILSAETQLELFDGSVLFKGVAAKPFRIQQALLRARWRGSLSVIDQADLMIEGEDYSISLAGPVSLPTETDPWIRFEGKGKDWSISGLTPQEPKILARDVGMKLAVKEDGKLILLDKMSFSGPDVDLQLSGKLASTPLGMKLSANGALGAMPLRNAIRLWPSFLAPQTRAFFARTVQAGKLRRLELSLDLPEWALDGQTKDRFLPPDTLKLEASVEGGAIQFSTGLPLLSGVTGQGRMNLKQAEGSATVAQVQLRGGKTIPLTENSFSITGLDGLQPKATARFRAQTPLENVVELLKYPDLKEAFVSNISSENLKGQFDGRGSVTLPLGVALKARDILTEFKGTMTSVSIDNAIGKDRLDNATLSLNSDASGFEVKGKGLWQNIPVSVELDRDSVDKSAAAVLSFMLDDAGLKRFGVSLGQPISRPIPIRIKTLREEGAALKANVEADLTPIAIDGLIPGLRKASGRPGKLTFDALERSGGYALQNISLDSGVASIKGTAELSNGAITSAKFNLFRLSPGDNVRLDYERTATGQKAVIRGNNFDARPFLKTEMQNPLSRGVSSGRNSDPSDLEIDLKTTLLSGFGGEVLTAPEMRLRRRGDNIRDVNLTGRLNGKSLQITGNSGENGARPITVATEDAGAFLRFIDVYTRMVGGQLTGQLSGTGKQVSGILQVNNFSLRNEPAVRRLVQSAPVPNTAAQNAAGEQVRRADTSDARFTKMRLQFALDNGKTTIRDAVIFGPEIGITFNGLVDNSRDRVSLSGTFVPAYGLNNALSQIPVFGNLLTGARNEGVLAVTFGVTGKASEPNVTINPLSAITPGIFRKIFEFRNETTGTLPINPTNSGTNPNN
jgi:hypothetical protein